MHHGSIIKKVIKSKGIPLTVLARKLCISRVTLYKRLREEKLPTKFFFHIGEAIGYDFAMVVPGVSSYRESYAKSFIESQKAYIKILEDYIKLFFLTTKTLYKTKKPIEQEAILHFMVHQQHLFDEEEMDSPT